MINLPDVSGIDAFREKVMNKYFISFVLLTAVLLLGVVSTVEAKSKRKKGDIVINADGGIGIGLFDTNETVTTGGLNGNVDILFLDFDWINMGVSSGYVSIGNSISNISAGKISSNTVFAIPLQFMIIKYFEGEKWNSLPYFHISPGIYWVNGLGLEFGASSGVGIYIPIAAGLYIDLSVRYHLISTFNMDKMYHILTSQMGICLRLQ